MYKLRAVSCWAYQSKMSKRPQNRTHYGLVAVVQSFKFMFCSYLSVCRLRMGNRMLIFHSLGRRWLHTPHHVLLHYLWLALFFHCLGTNTSETQYFHQAEWMKPLKDLTKRAALGSVKQLSPSWGDKRNNGSGDKDASQGHSRVGAVPVAKPTALPSRTWFQPPLPWLSTAPTDQSTEYMLHFVTRPPRFRNKSLGFNSAFFDWLRFMQHFQHTNTVNIRETQNWGGFRLLSQIVIYFPLLCGLTGMLPVSLYS